jgi:hypothetical protein
MVDVRVSRFSRVARTFFWGLKMQYPQLPAHCMVYRLSLTISQSISMTLTHLFVYLKLIQIVPYTPKNVGYGSHEISRLYLIVPCCKCAYIYIHIHNPNRCAYISPKSYSHQEQCGKPSYKSSPISPL